MAAVLSTLDGTIGLVTLGFMAAKRRGRGHCGRCRKVLSACLCAQKAPELLEKWYAKHAATVPRRKLPIDFSAEQHEACRLKLGLTKKEYAARIGMSNGLYSIKTAHLKSRLAGGWSRRAHIKSTLDGALGLVTLGNKPKNNRIIFVIGFGPGAQQSGGGMGGFEWRKTPTEAAATLIQFLADDSTLQSDYVLRSVKVPEDVDLSDKAAVTEWLDSEGAYLWNLPSGGEAFVLACFTPGCYLAVDEEGTCSVHGKAPK